MPIGYLPSFRDMCDIVGADIRGAKRRMQTYEVDQIDRKLMSCSLSSYYCTCAVTGNAPSTEVCTL
jgi:hypothetical protein